MTNTSQIRKEVEILRRALVPKNEGKEDPAKLAVLETSS